MVLQTVLFKKTKFTPTSAQHYLRTHGLKIHYVSPEGYTKPFPYDETKNYYRFRQAPPFKLANGWHYVTIKKDSGVYYVYAHKEYFGKK